MAELEPLRETASERVALDPDTWLSAGSVEAALRGSGAACFAVDQVFSGGAQNAFCVMRPPGHHAGVSTAMGFCLLNHAAVSVRHAQAEHGARRVAIVDFVMGELPVGPPDHAKLPPETVLDFETVDDEELPPH